MHISTFKDLFAHAEDIGMGQITTTALESFYFRCRLLGCTKKTQSVYAERLGDLPPTVFRERQTDQNSTYELST